MNVNEIIDLCSKLRNKGDYAYTLAKYVDSGYWISTLNNFFTGKFIENITDYNYSTCFTYLINLSDTEVKVGTNNFKDYLGKNKVFYRLQIQISAIAPFMIYKFV